MQNFTFLRKRIALTMVFSIVLFFTACEKPTGYGGTSSISGTITTRYYNEDYSLFIKEIPAVDEDVFLLFDDSGVVGDKVATGPEGNFEFSYLRPGTYTVYIMSEDTLTLDDDEVVQSMSLELTAGEEKDIRNLKEIKSLDFDDGFAKIFGVIKLINYKNTSEYPFMEIKDTSFAQEQEVYLIYGDHEYYDERIRTSYDGYFEFSNLIPGDYKVFTYSEDITGATEKKPVIREVTITDETEEVDLGEMKIEQL